MTAAVCGTLVGLTLWLATATPAPGWTLSGTGSRNRHPARSTGKPGMPGSARAGGAGGGEAGVPEVMDLLALTLAGGTGILPAVREVAGAVGGQRGSSLAQVAAALAWGYPDDRAWSAAGPEWEPVRRCLGLARRAGVPPAGLLAAAATDLRRDAAADLQVQTARLTVRLVLPLGLVFLPAFLLTTVVPVVLALAAGLLGG